MPAPLSPLRQHLHAAQRLVSRLAVTAKQSANDAERLRTTLDALADLIDTPTAPPICTQDADHLLSLAVVQRCERCGWCEPPRAPSDPLPDHATRARLREATLRVGREGDES